MQNPSVTFTCHVCGTVDEAQRAKAKEAGEGAAEDGVTPALLARLSRDGHFSLQNYLVSSGRIGTLESCPSFGGGAVALQGRGDRLLSPRTSPPHPILHPTLPRCLLSLELS